MKLDRHMGRGPRYERNHRGDCFRLPKGLSDHLHANHTGGGEERKALYTALLDDPLGQRAWPCLLTHLPSLPSLVATPGVVARSFGGHQVVVHCRGETFWPAYSRKDRHSCEVASRFAA